MSQKAEILATLKEGERLTALDALERFGCFRLAARIHELKQEGWNIVPEDVTLPNGKVVAAYRLARLELF